MDIEEGQCFCSPDFVLLFPDASRDHIDPSHLQQIAGFPFKGQAKEECCSQNRCFVFCGIQKHTHTYSTALFTHKIFYENTLIPSMYGHH